MISFDFDENKRKIIVNNSNDIEKKILIFFKKSLKGEISDIGSYFNKTVLSESDMADNIHDFIIDMNKSSYNDGYEFELQSLDDRLKFVIVEVKNNIKITNES